MQTQWKVSYFFSSPVVVQSPVSTYSGLGVSLYYGEDTLLERVEHDLLDEDKAGPAEVVIKSQEQLRLFWEVLHFRRGIPLPKSDITATKLAPEEMAPVHPRIMDAQTRVVVCNAIVMPTDQVFMHTDNRLFIWLCLANMARHAPEIPEGDVGAIRNYYMVWEDLHGTPNDQTKPKEAWELKLIRDLVSHGYKLFNKDLRKLTIDQCGRVINQFDPIDKVQWYLVHRYRTIGHGLIEAELDHKLR